MARARKDGQYLNVKIDSAIYHRLEDFCVEAGFTKTVVVERALVALMDDYTAGQETLRKIADGTVSIVDNRKE